MTKTVLVTGSLGYIGSRLTQYLDEAGLHSVGYDTGFFQDCRLYPSKDPKTIRRDVRELDKSDLAGVDAVVHLAAISNDPFGSLNPERIYDPTRAYTLRLAKLCKEMDIRFIFSSSCSVYGIGKDCLLTEQSETFSQTPYSANKLQIESDLRKIADSSFSPIILRFATVYGLSPRMRFDVVVNMLAGMAITMCKIILNSDGKAWRPLVHIDDVCKAIKQSVDLQHDSGEPLILNVGDTTQNLQILEIANMIKKQIPDCEIQLLRDYQAKKQADELDLVRDRKIQDGVDTRTYRISFELIKEILPGFQCDWTLDRGIQSMIGAFKKLRLTEEQFKNINFYRLQKLDSLFKNGCLSEDLYWKR